MNSGGTEQRSSNKKMFSVILQFPTPERYYQEKHNDRQTDNRSAYRT